MAAGIHVCPFCVTMVTVHSNGGMNDCPLFSQYTTDCVVCGCLDCAVHILSWATVQNM